MRDPDRYFRQYIDTSPKEDFEQTPRSRPKAIPGSPVARRIELPDGRVVILLEKRKAKRRK